MMTDEGLSLLSCKLVLFALYNTAMYHVVTFHSGLREITMSLVQSSS